MLLLHNVDAEISIARQPTSDSWIRAGLFFSSVTSRLYKIFCARLGRWGTLHSEATTVLMSTSQSVQDLPVEADVQTLFPNFPLRRTPRTYSHKGRKDGTGPLPVLRTNSLRRRQTEQISHESYPDSYDESLQRDDVARRIYRQYGRLVDDEQGDTGVDGVSDGEVDDAGEPSETPEPRPVEGASV